MDKEIQIDVGRCFKAVFAKWWKIAIVSGFVFLVAFIVSFGLKDSYEATTTVYSAVYGSYQESLEGTKMMAAYSEIIKSSSVADRAAKLLGNNEFSAEDVKGMFSVSYTEDSAVLTITASADSEKLAVGVANAVAESFITQAKGSIGGDSLQILDKATDASKGALSKQMMVSLVAFIATAFIMALVIFIKEIGSDEIYYVEDASLNGEVEILGVIPRENQI